MKFSILSFGLMTMSALAAPTPSMINVKRAGLAKRTYQLDDVATTGFATMNGGTSGGKGGRIIAVGSFDELTEAAKGDAATIILITGPVRGMGGLVRIGSNKSIIGKDASVVLTDFTLLVKDSKNVIIRNLAMEKIIGADAIAVADAQNVWIDHVDLSSDRDHDKDYYDGLIDITHASDFVTVSNSFLHDHWKCSLVGHSDSNRAEDSGHLTVTFNNNFWKNINSRGPSFRFGTGHVYNNYFEDVNDGVNSRQGAELLVENNVFEGATKAVYSTNKGFVVESGNDFGGSKNTAPQGDLVNVPYEVPELLDAAEVKDAVVGTAGVTLVFNGGYGGYGGY